MKVVAIGAGVSGLTLAAALTRLDPRVEVELYERDADALSRFQGYSLGLKGEGGLPVLRQLGTV
jgi:2-polyprenyl-6-methoxyphenol hydroxylase-like FAD-dependent oxidoreductase